MISKALKLMTDEELRRVFDAPLEDWRAGALWRSDGRRCLLGHAGDVCDYEIAGFPLQQIAYKQLHERLNYYDFVGMDRKRNIALTFDRLVHRFGLPRVVRAIKIRTLAILVERKPFADNYVLTLR